MQFFQRFLVVLAALFLTVLAGCTGESNNLADPVAGSRAVCEEVYSAEECIPGRFIADAVVNLNYECGRVKGVTGVDGSFACPKSTQVTFSITNPDTTVENAKSITLGQTMVRKPALLCVRTPNNDCLSSSVGRLYVTPATLTNDTVAQNNMVRLLLALNRETYAGIPLDSPAHRIELADTDKEKMESLTESIVAGQFGKTADPSAADPDSFDAMVSPFLAALTPAVAALPSVADANKVLERGRRATSAGVYSANSLAGFTDQLGSSQCTNCGSPGLVGETTTKKFSADTWVLVDRKGRTIGYGLYATKNKSDTGPFLYACGSGTSTGCTPSAPLPMILQSPTAYSVSQYADVAIQNSGIPNVPLWPLNGRLKAMSYKLQDLIGQSVPQDPTSNSRTLTFFSGVMERGAVPGTLSTYVNLFGDNPDSGFEFGQWQLEDSTSGSNAIGNICPVGSMATSAIPSCTASGTAGNTSSYTLMHSVAASPTLDPQLWENFLLNNSGLPKIQFPINMEVTFKNSRRDNAGVLDPETLGTIYVSILRDGNIVTNLDYDPTVTDATNCNTGIDLDTLISEKGTQQYPLGVIQNISRTSTDDGIPNEVFMTPLVMVTDKALPVTMPAATKELLSFIQLQSNLNRSFVIRIGSKDDVKPKLDNYSVTVDAKGSNGCNAEDGCAVFVSNAGWAQPWRSWRSLAGDTNHKAKDIEGTVVTARAEKCY